ncbi:putative deacetylase LmbE-like domain-containing protein [Schizophyllum fasciatum]
MLSFRSASFIVLVLALVFAALQNPTEHGTNVLHGFDGAGNARVLLVTAHPDDEAMFFAPTLLALAAKNVSVYSLCLSVGNADGRGEERRREFGASLETLSVPETRRWVLDDPNLQDNFTATWDAKQIAQNVLPYVTSNAITTILTFDREGVSQHPNHRSLREGIRALLSSPDAPATRPRLFTLVTVPLASKYLGLIASLQANAYPTAAVVPVFVSGRVGYVTAVSAMLHHKSQMVWFRWLYVAFSRYMWVNEWFEVAVGV